MSTSSVVPACPTGLCVSREDFLISDFTVDGFLTYFTTTTGRAVPLETLRNDLGVYLKVLRSAMIELINEDYADFVNLSTNLVGLDRGIQQLEDPLQKFHHEVKSVQDSLDQTLQALHEKLAKREAIYTKKTALQNLEHITNTLNKVERLLGLGEHFSSTESVDMTGDLVERVAAEINHLNFCVSKCEASAFVDEMQPRLKAIGDRLHGSLEQKLMDAITEKNTEVTKRCLRIFATVDRIRDAENLVRSKIIAPYLEDHISEKSLNSDPMGLKGLYQRVLKIIPNQLQLLISLTSTRVQHGTTGSVKGYNFAANALWPEVVEKIEDNLGFIFSAGNPEKFFTNYGHTMDFLDEFESELGSLETIEAFRQMPSYINFMNRWNLPVYFQIRFQEIALPVETSMSNIFALSTRCDTPFKLAVSDTAVDAIHRCWDHSVFIPALTHRFWKLTLQIISRYATGVNEAAEKKSVVLREPSEAEVEKEMLKHSMTTMGLNELSAPAHKSHKRSSSDQGNVGQLQKEVEEEEDRHKNLILLYLDVQELIKYLPGIVQDEIAPKLERLPAEHQQLIVKGMDESCRQLEAERLPKLSDIIVAQVVAQSLPFLKQVSDIPRLYRRTNRDVPTKPCGYLISLLGPISTFDAAHREACSESVLRPWLRNVFNKVTVQYFTNVSEVLAAVQKMEESLRRLKRVREKAGTASENKGLSDDDKIRLQLLVDVGHYVKTMESLGVEKKSVEKVSELEELVEEATKACYEDYLKSTT